jgi:asparagine synthase (glutamine-hydrolysing)
MCGLVARLSPPPDRARLDRAVDRLAHRGPDDAGLYIGAGCGLGLRRLSIIDVDGGHQPMSSADGRVWLVCNGEIVNAPALRARLEASGHRFRTRCDVEVIIHGYEQWGLDVVERLGGMFAFVLWDTGRRRLLAARDRFGIKPLHFVTDRETLAIASEVRPLFELRPSLPRRADALALDRLFEVGFIPSPRTAFEGVGRVPAGHTLVHEHGRLQLRRYWSRESRTKHRAPRSHRDASNEFVHRLADVVDAWRLSDVPVGSLLSGGIDSASLARLLTDVGGQPIDTFSIGFDAASHDESADARRTSRRLGSRHHEVRFSMADFDRLPDVVRHLEEPRCSATSLPIYLLYRACREAGLKVVLTGEGADELLGGYHWFQGDVRLRPLLPLPTFVRRALASMPAPISPAGRRVLAGGGADPLARYVQWHEVCGHEQRTRLLGGSSGSLVDEWRERYGSDIAGRGATEQFTQLEAATRLVDEINMEVDRMSMAHSVEARPPFLDASLWEFCERVPATYKVTWWQNKRLLRRGMRGRLDRRLRCRAKRGLATPHAMWWRSARLPDWAEDVLTPRALSDAGLFDAAEVDRLLAAHRDRARDVSRVLMGVLTTQLWHERVLRPS